MRGDLSTRHIAIRCGLLYFYSMNKDSEVTKTAKNVARITGKQAKAIRDILRLQAKDVARFSGLSGAHMSSIENGEAAMPVYVDTILFLLEKFEQHGAVKAVMERNPRPPGRGRGRPPKTVKEKAEARKKRSVRAEKPAGKNWNEVIQEMNETSRADYRKAAKEGKV